MKQSEKLAALQAENAELRAELNQRTRELALVYALVQRCQVDGVNDRMKFIKLGK